MPKCLRSPHKIMVIYIDVSRRAASAQAGSDIIRGSSGRGAAW